MNLYWKVSDPGIFTINNPTANPVHVSRKTGSASGSATLTAVDSVQGSPGVYIISKTITTGTVTVLPPAISGSTLLCRSGQIDLSVTNPPAGGYTWSKSSNLNLSVTGSHSVSITASSGSGAGAEGWVKITYGNSQITKNIWIGYPDVQISGSEYVSSDGYYTSVNNTLSNAIYFTWEMDSNSPNSYEIFSNGKNANILFYANGAYRLHLEACNSCGCESTYKDITVYGRSQSPIVVYPNPASDILSVDINVKAVNSVKDLYRKTNGTNANFEPVFELRLYDMQGKQVRSATAKSGIVQFDVSKLPNGNYFLHIYDGVDEKPEVRLVIVKH